ncbi:NAD-P-binding protein [Cubamyces sp. BRFM 1775]|nr:NAD-P-binding protein [Cubamyces sp. BRFM 1775]
MSTAQRRTTWLITGTSRGIGYEIVRQLVQSADNVVIAACRHLERATHLHALKDTATGNLHIVTLDVSDFEAIRGFPRQLEPILGEIGLDYLINNAGISIEDTAFTIDPEEFLRVLRTNVAGPALLAQVCLPLLKKSSRKVILNVSSFGGSHVQHFGNAYASYAMTKAALNMLTVKQKAEHPDMIMITMCPGWVKTEMGGAGALIEPEESVLGILKLITSVTAKDSGRYLRYNGEEIPW